MIFLFYFCITFLPGAGSGYGARADSNFGSGSVKKGFLSAILFKGIVSRDFRLPIFP